MADTDLANSAFRDTDPNHRFNPPTSAFSFNRRARPPPMDFSASNMEENRVPLSGKKIDRRASKGGLRGIFTRTKGPMEKSIVSPVLEEPVSTISSTFHNKDDGTSLSITRSTTATSPATPATPATPASRMARSSRMNFKSKSVKPKKQTAKPSPKSTKSSPGPPTRTSAAWDPPPLFQAYPQAVKHATLAASTLSADAILRLNNHSRNHSLREDISQTSEEAGNLDQNSAAAKKNEKAKSKHRRQISGSMSKADWTRKIFVLVTSGYLLQYAGDGSFDRLPEKMMQLGKDSVAFASDAIPGKHWVLQISQAMDPDGAPTADSRSLLSRLAFRGGDYRRAATSLLLVMDCAEDMDSWLAVVRREIEALGGKKHASETGKPKPDEKVMQLRAQPSHRYLVQRSPDRSGPTSPTSPTSPWNDSPGEDSYDETHPDLIKPQNSYIQGSVAESEDGHHLEFLRESTNRFSMMSSGQRTLYTSQCSTPSTSPTRESCSTLDDYHPPKISIEDPRLRPNASAINERRRSMQTMPIPVLEANTPSQYRPHSTYGSGQSRPIRSQSPTTPNFSFPSSKRFSAAKGPPLSYTGTDFLTPPTVATASPERKDKALPSVPLETLQYTSRLTTTTLVFQSAVEDNPQIRPSLGDSYSRQSNSERRSSFMPSSSSNKDTFMDFQFPRRYSSMQTLNDMKGDPRNYKSPDVKAPLIVAPLLNAPHIGAMSKSQHLTVEKESSEGYIVSSHTQGKLRRPKSMQVRTSEESPLYASHNLSQFSLRPRVISNESATSNALRTLNSNSNLRARQANSKSPSPPSAQRDPLKEKKLAGRQSLPVLVTGPPPAPPPRCALPPLPPPQKPSMLKASTPHMRYRNSVAS